MTPYKRLGRTVGPFIVGIGLAALVVNGCASPPQTIEGVVVGVGLEEDIYVSGLGYHNSRYSLVLRGPRGDLDLVTYLGTPADMRALNESIQAGAVVAVERSGTGSGAKYSLPKLIDAKGKGAENEHN